MWVVLVMIVEIPSVTMLWLNLNRTSTTFLLYIRLTISVSSRAYERGTCSFKSRLPL